MNVWIKATRPWTLQASVMPVILTASYIFFLQQDIAFFVNWALLPLVIFANVCYQAGMNMISDVDDLKSGIDNEHSIGHEKLLVKGKADIKTWKIVAHGWLALGTGIGIWLVFKSGYHLLWIGGIGLISGYFYNIFKKYALGDLLIFTIFGLLTVQGTFFVLTSELSLTAVLLAFPPGLLITAILHANNTRDMFLDEKAGIRSRAFVLGFRGAQRRHAVLIFGAFLMVVIMAVSKILPYQSLLILLTLPIALANVKTMFKASPENLEPILSLDEATAKLQIVFTVLLSLGIAGATLF